MSEPKHTPGPYYAAPGDQMNNPDTTVAKLGYIPASPQGSWCIYSKATNHGDEQATAKVLAAAPELLEALILLCKDMGIDEYDELVGYGKNMQLALRAIKKATE